MSNLQDVSMPDIDIRTQPTQNEANLIELDKVSISYPGRVAVENIDLKVGENEFVSIIGPSGCGKSTLLHVLSGLSSPSSGHIRVRGRRVDRTIGDVLRAGYVFQDHRLLPWRTVRRNLHIAMKCAGIPQSEWDERCTKYLDLLHVGEHIDAWPMRLSGGQRQRVSIARALAVNPDVVLMDEPFSGLDEVTARSIRQQLDKARVTSNPPTIFVTHSIREALYLSDRVVMLSRGPARVLKVIDVPISRPRAYDDPRLVELERAVVAEVMQEWDVDNESKG